MDNNRNLKMYLEGPSTMENEKQKSIEQLFDELFQKNSPSKICLILDNEELTIEMLSKGIQTICKLLKNEICVGICMDLSFELIIVLCGLLLIGVPYVPLEPQLPDERLKYIIEDSQPSIIITTDKYINLTFNENMKIITYNQLINNSSSSSSSLENEIKKNDEDIFCIMYTSGSTGHPKGVRLPYRALINRLDWQWKTFPFHLNEKCCLKTSISFVDSICEIFAPLLQGIPLIIIPKSLLLNINELIDVLNIHKVTRLIVVPSLLSVLLEYISIEKKKIEYLEYIISSGETLSPNLVQGFFNIYENNCQLLNLYGSTEVMADVTFERFSSLNDLNQKSIDGRISIGKPIQNMRVDIFNPDDQGIGELIVSGQGVANGYHHQQTLTDKFIPDINNQGKFTFHTGDMGTIWNDRIILYGRSDNQVKISGNRINLNEIELILKSHFNCREPIVLMIDSQIIVFLKENEKENNLDRNSLATYLPTYAIPTSFIRLKHFPLLVSGKIDLYRLKYLANENLQEETKEEISSQRISAFSHALEEIGIQRSSIDRNFFGAGGSSLNALLVVAKLHNLGFHNITVQRLITAPTLRDIELDLSKSNNQTKNYFDEQIENTNHFHFIPLEQVDQQIAFQILSESFVTHGEIDTLIHKHQIQLKEQFKKQWTNLMNFNWDTYLKSNLSFGVIDQNNRLIGLSLSFNINNSPQTQSIRNHMELLTPLNTIIDVPLFQRIEQLTQIEHLTKIMRSHVTTVDPNLTPAQRLTTMYFIEKHLLDVAKLNNYQAVITANTSSVTQQLAEHVLKYDTHHITRACESTDPITGECIFPQAPNHYTVIISVKYIH